MDIYAFLEKHGIAYQRIDHPPVATCEEARAVMPDLPATETKNLFLKDRKGRRHFLVAMGYDTKVDLKALAQVLGTKNLSFASPERLMRFLGVEPGSVTLLGVVHDRDHAVEVVIEKALWQSQALGCHPCVNTATLILSIADLERFFQATGHEPRTIDLTQAEPSAI